MTATRLAKGSTLFVAAAAWIVAGWFLWQTTVPGNLHLSGLDPHRYWSNELLHRSAHYDGLLRWVWVAAVIAGIATLVVLVKLAPRTARAWELGRVGTGVMVGAVATLALWAVSLPFGLVALWWGRRYGIEKQGYAEWLVSQWPALLGQVVGLTIVLTILMLLAGRFPRWWWLPAGVLFTFVAFVLILVLPWVMTIGDRRPHHTKLASQIRALERKEGIGGTPVWIENASERTTQANAESVGIGPSARVIIWDTLLDGRYSAGEIRVVAAHEFGHIARRHIWKGLGWYVLIELPGFFVLAWLTARRGGMARPEVVPFALLVITVFHLAVTPFSNVLSRRYEAEADWRALVATHDPGSAVKLFRGFGRYDLVQPDPPGWSYVWIDNHPTLAQRVAMANAWAARRAR
jgi:Zn-dependent protease with chaperone function